MKDGDEYGEREGLSLLNKAQMRMSNFLTQRKNLITKEFFDKQKIEDIEYIEQNGRIKRQKYPSTPFLIRKKANFEKIDSKKSSNIEIPDIPDEPEILINRKS